MLCKPPSELRSLTTKSHFRKHKQIQSLELLGLCFIKNGIGAVEVVVNVTDLRRELETCDPHLAHQLRRLPSDCLRPTRRNDAGELTGL